LSSAVVLAAFAQGDGDYGTGDDPLVPDVSDDHFAMKFVSQTVQMGSYPYLLGGGSVHKTENTHSCEASCLAEPDCKFGTFITHGARHGECWLSGTTHEAPTDCGVPCQSFAKDTQANVDQAVAERCHRGKVWDTTATPSCQTTCDDTSPDCTAAPVEAGCACPADKPIWDEAAQLCKDVPSCTPQFQATNPTCECDPATHPSRFTFCKQDPFGYHIQVSYLSPKFHQMTFVKGYQHTCKMISGNKCSCCECLPPQPEDDVGTETEHHDDALGNMQEIGSMIHAATSPFLTETPPLTDTEKDCKDMCHQDDNCNAGTWIKSGLSKGECWLSATVLVEPATCTKPCQSFVKTGIGEPYLNANTYHDLEQDAYEMLHTDVGRIPDMCYNDVAAFGCASNNMYSWKNQEHTALPARIQCYEEHQCATDPANIGIKPTHCYNVCDGDHEYTPISSHDLAAAAAAAASP